MTTETPNCAICKEMLEMFKKHNRQIVDKCPECGSSLQYVKPSLGEILAPLFSIVFESVTDIHHDIMVDIFIDYSDAQKIREFSEINKILSKMYTYGLFLKSNYGPGINYKNYEDAITCGCRILAQHYILVAKIYEPCFVSFCSRGGIQIKINCIFTQSDIEKNLPFFVGKNYITDDINLGYTNIYSFDHLIMKYKFNLAQWANDLCLNSVPPAGV